MSLWVRDQRTLRTLECTSLCGLSVEGEVMGGLALEEQVGHGLHCADNQLLPVRPLPSLLMRS